jgi:hypothetical protein
MYCTKSLSTAFNLNRHLSTCKAKKNIKEADAALIKAREKQFQFEPDTVSSQDIINDAISNATGNTVDDTTEDMSADMSAASDELTPEESTKDVNAVNNAIVDTIINTLPNADLGTAKKPVKTFKCGKCSYSSNVKCNLEKHVSRKHSSNIPSDVDLYFVPLSAEDFVKLFTMVTPDGLLLEPFREIYQRHRCESLDKSAIKSIFSSDSVMRRLRDFILNAILFHHLSLYTFMVTDVSKHQGYYKSVSGYWKAITYYSANVPKGREPYDPEIVSLTTCVRNYMMHIFFNRSLSYIKNPPEHLRVPIATFTDTMMTNCGLTYTIDSCDDFVQFVAARSKKVKKYLYNTDLIEDDDFTTKINPPMQRR